MEKPGTTATGTAGADRPMQSTPRRWGHSRPGELRCQLVRVGTDFSNSPIKGKIQDAEQRRVHTMLVFGGRDMDAGAVSVRLHGKGPQGAKAKGEVVAEILAAIRERRA